GGARRRLRCRHQENGRAVHPGGRARAGQSPLRRQRRRLRARTHARPQRRVRAPGASSPLQAQGKMKPAAALVLVPLVACVPAPTEDTAREAQAILHGTVSDASQDAVVLVMRYESGKPATLGGCSGTLLTPKLVLTARHCVATTDEASACASDGTPI